MPIHNDNIPSYDNCHEVTSRCKVEYTVFGDYLSKGASALFVIAFTILLLLQIWYGTRGRMWSFMIWLGIGTLFELLGYCGRYALSKNPWDMNAFLIQYLTLLLGPTLTAAAISITFKYLVIWYGPQWSIMRPKLYPLVFVGTDIISIFVQVVGGGMIAVSTTGKGNGNTKNFGEGLVIGGVIFQVVNMLCCATLMLVYAKRRRSSLRVGFEQMDREESPSVPLENSARKAKRVKVFCVILGAAYTAIIIRCTYRIFETLPATSEKVIRNETLFYVFDGALILFAIGLVTIFHPYKMFPSLSQKDKQEQQYGLR
ncbi:hypothetical protein FOMG_07639 [Fusarium oxysporum f. sp. melonis 26406]|uniref:Sphingoid long-chain base transporter RSB1 n=1 Tax=Fusarium oxysporum f. sp. melonis 26406 TaxID=1089452 RepID=X0AB63_FUSOX|nr:hypothetical protein FOMG_07639 [Fusarium oxysporum f. sp. melonis 26406]